MRVAVLVSGRGSNLQALLDAQKVDNLPVEFVGVGSDQAGCLALERAKKAGIPVASFALKDYDSRKGQEQALLDWLKKQKPELLVLAGYLRVLGTDFINEIGIPIINIHPSLLPAFKGLHAQRQALEYGVKISGCTVHFVDDGLDSGPIILQEAVPVQAGDTEDSLAERILQAEHRLLPQAVRLIAGHKVERNGRQVTVKDKR